MNHGEGDDPTKWVDAGTRLFAVIMPNDTTVPKTNWRQYQCSVEKVEQATGLKFFDKAPADIIGPLKKKGE